MDFNQFWSKVMSDDSEDVLKYSQTAKEKVYMAIITGITNFCVVPTLILVYKRGLNF